jgi:hypothetical protein
VIEKRRGEKIPSKIFSGVRKIISVFDRVKIWMFKG